MLATGVIREIEFAQKELNLPPRSRIATSEMDAALIDAVLQRQPLLTEVEQPDSRQHAYLNDWIRKPWGAERRVLSTDSLIRELGHTLFDAWLLRLIPQAQTSTHAHPKKETMLYTLEGRGELRVQGVSYRIRPGDYVILAKGVVHQTANIGLRPLVVVEVELPRDKFDIVRIDDPYSRPSQYEDASQALPPLHGRPEPYRFALAEGIELARSKRFIFAVPLSLTNAIRQIIEVRTPDS